MFFNQGGQRVKFQFGHAEFKTLDTFKWRYQRIVTDKRLQ